MSGIDRLRAIAGAWDEWGLGGTLAEMADQIESERAEDCYHMGLDCGTVWRVVADMERHCLGHEGMEDSPVARWARELRDALKSDTSDGSDKEKPSCPGCHDAADATFGGRKVTRDLAEDVSMSAYDLLPADEREAIAWVREHGGIEGLSRLFQDADSRRVELCAALGIDLDKGWSEAMAAMRLRLMPEGIEWPRYESGELVGFGDEVSRLGEDFEANVIALYRDGSFSLNFWAYSKGERVRRPAPAVPAADGEPIEVGQTVWDKNGDELVVVAIEDGGNTVTCRYTDVGDGIPTHGMWSPSDLTHQHPVLDADGVEIREGDTVYLLPGTWCDEFPCLGFHGGEELEVFDDEEAVHVSGGVQCREKGKKVGFRGYCYPQPSQLTHTKPEIDSWERIEEDARLKPLGYVDRVLGWDMSKSHGQNQARSAMTHDLVRRCRALAERERGEA